MSYLLVGLIVLVALAPLWQFKPSKVQRKQAQLREAAALAGLFVEFRDCPLPDYADRERKQWVFYGARLQPARSKPRESVFWHRVNDGGVSSGVLAAAELPTMGPEQRWLSKPALRPLPDLCSELANSWVAVSVSDNSCGAFWDESGDSDEVQKVAKLMLTWKRLLESAGGVSP
ncbi:MAG: hypothetical protein AAF194_06245 [Pseudomonadota bacterium]